MKMLKEGTICTSNSMGSSEIWDKYHECCIGNLPFPIQQEWINFPATIETFVWAAL